MYRYARYAFALALAVLLTGCPQSGGVQLQAAPTKPAYMRGEPVSIVVNLTNKTGATAGISTVDEGNIDVQAATRDGAPLAGHATTIKYDDDLRSILQAAVTSVAAGAVGSLSWTSATDPAQGVQALRSVRVDQFGRGAATFYPLGAPGRYRFTFVYHFAGFQPATGAFQGTVGPATVEFTVT
jgi:hypothetical protein